MRVVGTDGDDLGSVHDVMNHLTPVAPLGEESDWTRMSRTFDPPARLVHRDGSTQPVSALHVHSRWMVARREIRVGGTEEVLLIVRDAL